MGNYSSNLTVISGKGNTVTNTPTQTSSLSLPITLTEGINPSRVNFSQDELDCMYDYLNQSISGYLETGSNPMDFNMFLEQQYGSERGLALDLYNKFKGTISVNSNFMDILYKGLIRADSIVKNATGKGITQNVMIAANNCVQPISDAIWTSLTTTTDNRERLARTEPTNVEANTTNVTGLGSNFFPDSAITYRGNIADDMVNTATRKLGAVLNLNTQRGDGHKDMCPTTSMLTSKMELNGAKTIDALQKALILNYKTEETMVKAESTMVGLTGSSPNLAPLPYKIECDNLWAKLTDSEKDSLIDIVKVCGRKFGYAMGSVGSTPDLVQGIHDSTVIPCLDNNTQVRAIADRKDLINTTFPKKNYIMEALIANPAEISISDLEDQPQYLELGLDSLKFITNRYARYRATTPPLRETKEYGYQHRTQFATEMDALSIETDLFKFGDIDVSQPFDAHRFNVIDVRRPTLFNFLFTTIPTDFAIDPVFRDYDATVTVRGTLITSPSAGSKLKPCLLFRKKTDKLTTAPVYYAIVPKMPTSNAVTDFEISFDTSEIDPPADTVLEYSPTGPFWMNDGADSGGLFTVGVICEHNGSILKDGKAMYTLDDLIINIDPKVNPVAYGITLTVTSGSVIYTRKSNSQTVGAWIRDGVDYPSSLISNAFSILPDEVLSDSPFDVRRFWAKEVVSRFTPFISSVITILGNNSDESNILIKRWAMYYNEFKLDSSTELPILKPMVCLTILARILIELPHWMTYRGTSELRNIKIEKMPIFCYKTILLLRSKVGDTTYTGTNLSTLASATRNFNDYHKPALLGLEAQKRIAVVQRSMHSRSVLNSFPMSHRQV